MKHHDIALILALVASAGACGKDAPSTHSNADHADPAAATTTGRKPCSYVTRADAEKAVGLTLPNTADDETLHECRYDTPEFYGSNVTITDWDQCKSALTSQRPTAVGGLGDEALFVREHLFIRKGDRCVSVEINGPLPNADKDDGLARVKGLALTVLAKL